MLLFLNFFTVVLNKTFYYLRSFLGVSKLLAVSFYHPPPRSEVLRGSRSQIMQVRYKKGIMKQIGGNCLLRSETSQAFDRL